MHSQPVVLVTGASKGIGLQIAKDLAAHGFVVLLGSRKLESLQKGIPVRSRTFFGQRSR